MKVAGSKHRTRAVRTLRSRPDVAVVVARLQSYSATDFQPCPGTDDEDDVKPCSHRIRRCAALRASFYRNVPQDAATRIRHARFRSQIIVPLATFSLVSLGPRGSWNFLDDSSMFDHDSTLL